MPKSKQRIERRLALRHRRRNPNKRTHHLRGPRQTPEAKLSGAPEAFREQLQRIIDKISRRPMIPRRVPK